MFRSAPTSSTRYLSRVLALGLTTKWAIPNLTFLAGSVLPEGGTNNRFLYSNEGLTQPARHSHDLFMNGVGSHRDRALHACRNGRHLE
jgi:hypothetical protein